MIHSTIAALTLAAATAVKLEKTDYDYTSFSASNIRTEWSEMGTKAKVSFDAPSTDKSAVKDYTVHLKNSALNKEFTCAKSPCVFDVADLAQAAEGDKVEVLVKPNYATKFTVPFPMFPNEATWTTVCNDGQYHSLQACGPSRNWDHAADLLATECKYDIKDSRITNVNDNGQSLLFVAGVDGHKKLVNQLISMGADVNAKDNNGFRPIAQAFSHPDIVDIYIAAGADLNVEDNGGNNLVMNAAKIGDIRSLRAIVEAGAPCTSKKDSNDKSPMDYAKGFPAEQAQGLTFILENCTPKAEVTA